MLHTYTHIYIHAYTHTHIHTYTGHAVLVEATKAVPGEGKPFSVMGSLPLVVNT